MPDEPKKLVIPLERAQDILRRIIDRLPDGRMPPCVLCAQTKWQLAVGFINLILTDNPGQLAFEDENLPCVALVCGVCGNTHLMNTKVLGIPIVITPDPAELKLTSTSPDVRQEPEK